MSSEQQTSAQPLLCVSGCGFYGNPATLDMCSVCYRRHCLLNGAATATAPSPSATAAASTKAVASAATVLTGAAAPDSCFAPSVGAKGAASSSKNPDPSLAAAVAVEKKAPANRCASCKKKVGLTGFACRCGATYCGSHRYPEKHACGFDFKGAGRDAIARANPVIKGEKLTDKI